MESWLRVTEYNGRRLMRVEAVGVLPSAITSGRNFEGNKRFWRDDRAHRPQSKLSQRLVGGNHDPRSSFLILDPHLVIGGTIAESDELVIEGIASLQLFREHKPLALHFGQRVHGRGRL